MYFSSAQINRKNIWHLPCETGITTTIVEENSIKTTEDKARTTLDVKGGQKLPAFVQLEFKIV